ncbi:hypothetical protein DSO57_1027844 [Entomophthora muscae]|uniref:Uncharacterized protein n=1 Tax=Entomophthora muscae TaxID=34485 RepID=A0ACC2TNH3_9FUNG|nr:hypothetical protein DSO57_1027844 [Entomophthora muscae]
MPAKTTEATHPKYVDMIKSALNTIKDRKGISRPAISKYVITTYKVSADQAKVHIKTALRRGVMSGSFKQDGQRFRNATSGDKAAPKKKPAKKANKKASSVLKKKVEAKKAVKKVVSKKVKKSAKPKKAAIKKAAPAKSA